MATAALLLAALLGTSGQESPEAHRLAQQSMREYNTSDFEAALQDAKAAYDLSGAPALLFDIGQCQRALGRWKEAVFSFHAYLRERPDAPNRPQVEAILQEIAKQEAAAPPAAPPAAKPAPPPASAPPAVVVVASPAPPAPAAAVEAPAPAKRQVPVAAWIVGSLGVAAAVAGAVAWGVAGSERSGYVGSGPEPASLTYAGVQQSNALAVAGNVLVPVAAGLVAVAAGLALFSGH